MLHKKTETIKIKKMEKSCNPPYMILKLIQKDKRQLDIKTKITK